MMPVSAIQQGRSKLVFGSPNVNIISVPALNSCVEYRYTFTSPCLPPGNGLKVSIK